MTDLQPKDLTGEARERYDTWRALGLSEAAALAVLREDGTLPQAEGDTALVETFQSMGLTVAEARIAAGSDGRSSSKSMRISESASVGVRLAESILELGQARASERYRQLSDLGRSRFDAAARGKISDLIPTSMIDKPWTAILGEAGRARLMAGAAALGTTSHALLDNLAGQ